MKAAICCLNSKYIHSSLAPWCLLAGIRAYCHAEVSAKVIEGTVNEPQTAVLTRISRENPDVVGFCTYIWNVTAVLAIAAGLKQQNDHIQIVLGGPEVSYNAAEVLQKNPPVDYVISGEGERPFAELLNALQNGGDLSAVGGLCYRTEGELHISAPNLPTEDPVSPYCDEYFETLNGRIAYLETSRGCPYSCAFCLSGRCGSVRFFDLETAKRNMLALANSGAKTVKLVDRTFNANKSRAYALFDFVIQQYGGAVPAGVCFHFEIAGDILDDRLIELLNRAPKGSIQLEIGLQSFQEQTLSYIRRKTDTAKLIANIQRLIAPRNIHIHIDLIAGLPFETAELFADSFNRAFCLQPDMLQFGFLKLLHGAPMREEAEAFPCTFSEAPPYEVQSTPWLSAAELQRLHQTEDVFDRVYNSGRFRRTVAYVLAQTQKTPFSLFADFAEYLADAHTKTEGISLDRYTALLFAYLSALPAVDSGALRDKMVCDRLATNASGVLPAVLRVQDVRLKAFRTYLQQNADTRAPVGVKRAAAILYSAHCAVYVDYTSADPVTGEYRLHFVSNETILEN